MMANRMLSPSWSRDRTEEINTQGCIRCCAWRVNCDSVRPKCNRCTVDNLPSCLYEWNLENVVALFPSHYNMNQNIVLHSVEAITDSGGFGKVYRTSLQSNGLHVAVKVLFQKKKTPQRLLMLALREALTWSQLSHEHLLPLIGVADYGAICHGAPAQLCLVSPWMTYGNVMEYFEGNPTADRSIILLDITNAVCYLHSRSPAVIHGDIRGSNILVDVRDGQPRGCLTDFGLSFIVEENGRHGMHQSTSTANAGHPRWIAPERLFPTSFSLSPSTSKSEASDVFEMCRTFLEILSGTSPFPGINDWGVAQLVLEGKHPERPNSASEELTDVIWAALERGWARDRADRPSAVEIHAIIITELRISNKGSLPIALDGPSQAQAAWSLMLSGVQSSSQSAATSILIRPPFEAQETLHQDDTANSDPHMRSRWWTVRMLVQVISAFKSAGRRGWYAYSPSLIEGRDDAVWSPGPRSHWRTVRMALENMANFNIAERRGFEGQDDSDSHLNVARSGLQDAQSNDLDGNDASAQGYREPPSTPNPFEHAENAAGSSGTRSHWWSVRMALQAITHFRMGGRRGFEDQDDSHRHMDESRPMSRR